MLSVRAGEALNIVKYEVPLKQPRRILATNLRKHTATISQVMGLEDQQLPWLVIHMGHTEKVHMQKYRSTSGLIERLDIPKIMLLQEKNAFGRFAGVKLDDIRFEDIEPDERPSDEHQHELAVADSTVYFAEASEQDVSEDEGVKPKKRPSFNDTSDESETETCPKKRKISMNSKVKRIPWSKEEVQEIDKYFKQFVELKSKRKCPGMQDCLHAIARSKADGGMLWKRQWDTI